ncbi:SMP-30/gluconolactonase/LRE family protein (plasmid) [Tistrella mobilis]|uniref:SMP-30/gluconolactonase/LRE family protein n=1 Tax=Tistrella mobilis TaxID=171437 RepID=UPI0035574D82
MTEQLIPARKVADGLVFGEGIRWQGDRIVLSDMIGRRVVRVDPADGRIETLLEVSGQPNGLAVAETMDVFILSMFDGKVLRYGNDGAVSVHADLSSVVTGYLGDAVLDAGGTLYVDDVGSRILHGEPPSANGRVIRITADGRVDTLLTGLSFPNGIVISADGRRLYLAQSLSQPPSIRSYSIGEDGSLADEQLFVVPPAPTDGMGIDDDDGVWACVAAGDAGVYRYDRTGRLTHRVVIEGYEPISCSIGGPDGRTMAITAIQALHGKSIFDEMRAGRVQAAVFLADVPFEKRMARP